MLKYLLLIFILINPLVANYQSTYDRKNILADFEKGGEAIEKYKLDTFITLQKEELVSRGVMTDSKSLTSEADSVDCAEFLANGNFTATIYRLDPKSGRVSCMVANTGNLYNPIGVFDVYYPKIEAKFKKNYAQSQGENATALKTANEQFKVLTNEKKKIASEIAQNGAQYLNIPQLLLSSVLTDVDIIDMEATLAAGRLQLQDGYTAKIYRENAGVTDNAEIIKSDASGLFSVYTGLSNLSMQYFYFIFGFAMIFGAGGFALNYFSDQVDKTSKTARKTPYAVGAIAGMLLFFPYNDHDIIHAPSGEEIGQFDIMKTRYQDFEKTGYYLFSDWANEIAKVTIDTEMDGLIDKAGLSNQQQIIDSHAALAQYRNLTQYAAQIDKECFETFKKDWFSNIDKMNIYSDNPNTLFPLSENWAYAASWGKIGGADYYNKGLVLSSGYSAFTINQAREQDLNLYYPRYSMSACAHNNLLKLRYQDKMIDYTKSYHEAIFSGDTAEQSAKKIAVLRNLTHFQYELYRDWGFLAVLALPVTKMQTEYIGGLYRTENSFLKKANEEINGGNIVGEAVHNLVSSLPYGLLPGVMSVYTFTEQNAHIIGAATGAAAGASGGWIGGLFGAVAGGVAAELSSSVIGFGIAVAYAKTIIVLSPILAILLFGLARFLIIIVKIFLIHFVSLVLLPVIFVSRNLEYFKTFSLKVFITMLELPVYVIAVWLAVMVNSLVHSIGDVFSKKIILGMIENNKVSSAAKEISLSDFASMNFEYINVFKIYVLDGFMQIGITIFSLVMIYVIILKAHSALFEMLELRGVETLDQAGEALSAQSRGFGGKI